MKRVIFVPSLLAFSFSFSPLGSVMWHGIEAENHHTHTHTHTSVSASVAK